MTSAARLSADLVLAKDVIDVATGDNIVDLRASSRTKPNFAQGSVGFSIESGIKYDTNTARKQLEDLRKSLRWDIVPVITGFDPKYNQDKTLW